MGREYFRYSGTAGEVVRVGGGGGGGEAVMSACCPDVRSIRDKIRQDLVYYWERAERGGVNDSISVIPCNCK